MIAIEVMTQMANHAGNEPWLSLEAASWWFNLASVVLGLSLFVGCVATGFIVCLGIVKEHHWDLAREAANKEIGQLFKAGEQLQKESQQLRRETAEAQLALEKFRKARLPTPEELDSVIETIKPFVGTKFDVGHGTEDREQWDFLWRIEPALSKAGWVHIDWQGGNTFKKSNWPGDHQYGLAGVNNVSIELHPENAEQLRPAADALVTALNKIGIEAAVVYFNNSSTNAEAIHFLVGPKR